MRRITVISLALLVSLVALCPASWGAGSCVEDIDNRGAYKVVTLTCTADSAAASFPTITLSPINGYIMEVETIPGTRVDVTSATYSWLLSAGGVNEYYAVLASTGGDPSLADPNYVLIAGSEATEGNVGALNAGEWDYGTNVADALGYNTIYVRLAGGDPDALGDFHIISIVAEPTTLYDIQMFTPDGTDITGTTNLLLNRSRTAVQRVQPLWNGIYQSTPVQGSLKMNVLNNSVNSAKIKINIYAFAD